MSRLLELLIQLEKKSIHYSLEHNRDDAIMVLVSIPGQRWEIEMFSDGHLEIEIFRSDGTIYDHEEIAKLFQNYAD
ncbi:MAG: hypothetical protein HUU21_40930 [Polyangiaceae bacterium]|nr:hypothetical protein [Polyangiaceae bacterium]